MGGGGSGGDAWFHLFLHHVGLGEGKDVVAGTAASGEVRLT